MHKHWDTIFGTAGAAGTITLGQINAALGIAVGSVTLVVMFLRARREWKNRNEPPPTE